MRMQTIKVTEHRKARAWYVRYPLDAYALGPYRFDDPVDAEVVVEHALDSFGERPCEVWPGEQCIEVDEYEFFLDVPYADLDNPNPSKDGYWGEDEEYLIEDWKADVENDDTRLGYHEWVARRRELDKCIS